MRKVHYEARPLDYDRKLEAWTDKPVAVAWAKHRNTNTALARVRLVEVVTLTTEREVQL